MNDFRIENIYISPRGVISVSPFYFHSDQIGYKINYHKSNFTVNVSFRRYNGAQPTTITITYAGQGTDMERQEIDISSEISGDITTVSASFTYKEDYINLSIGAGIFLYNYSTVVDPPPAPTPPYFRQIAFPFRSGTNEQSLDPGYYGGTFIPNYRKCWYIFPVGNDPEWYADPDYESKAIYNMTVFESNDVDHPGVFDIIQKATSNGQADSVVELFCHYSGFINHDYDRKYPYDDSNKFDYRWFLPIIRVGVNRPTSLQGGYVPKNNKLFCYPYASLELQGYGQNQELKYEDFDDKTSTLKYLGIVSKFLAGAVIMLYPFDYNGIEDNFDYGVCGNELPVMPYTIDKYLNEYHAARNTRTQNMAAQLMSNGYAAATAWTGGVNATNQINRIPGSKGVEIPSYDSDMASMLGTGNMGFTNNPNIPSAFSGSGIYEGATKSKLGVGYGAINITGGARALAAVGGNMLSIHLGYAAMAAELTDVQNRPAVVSNQNAAPSIPIAIKDGACPYVVYKSIRKEIAQRIDTFFTRFGYRTNRMGIPNIYKRPYFSFLKCHNAIIGGNIPAEDKEALKVILQKGVTFWHTSQPGFTQVGDYDGLSDLNIAAIR